MKLLKTIILFLVLNDRYCINIKQQDPVTDAKTNKNISSKDYYT
jgi:hypothetical protein